MSSLDKDSWNEGVGGGSDMQQRGQAGMEPSAAVKDSASVHGERALPGELPVNPINVFLDTELFVLHLSPFIF